MNEAPDEAAIAPEPPLTMEPRADPPALPEGVLAVRIGPGANCSSAGSTIDILFYGSAIVGAIAVALAAAFPPRGPRDDDDDCADSARGAEGGGGQPATGGGGSK